MYDVHNMIFLRVRYTYLAIIIIIRTYVTYLSGIVHIYRVVEMVHVNKNNSDYPMHCVLFHPGFCCY